MRCTWLADDLRAQGVDVAERPGWQSVGYDLSGVNCWFLHHTASGPSSDGAGDIYYIYDNPNNGLRPEYNAYVQRNGLVTIGAGGKCNHAGEGGNNGSSTGGRKSIPWLPANGANGYTVCLAIANNGTGEPYTAAQENAALGFARAVNRHAPPDHGISHAEWTTRKIDNAGQSRWATGGAIWDMNAFRRDVAAPDLPPTEDDMALLPYLVNDGAGSVWLVAPDLTSRIGLIDMTVVAALLDAGGAVQRDDLAPQLFRVPDLTQSPGASAPFSGTAPG